MKKYFLFDIFFRFVDRLYTILQYDGVFMGLFYIICRWFGIIVMITYFTYIRFNGTAPPVYLFCLQHAVSGMISGMIMTAFTFVGSMYNNVIYPTLPMSTNGCPANTNLTMRPNTTWSWDNATANYVFKGYRIFVGIYLYNGPTGDIEIIHWTIVPA